MKEETGRVRAGEDHSGQRNGRCATPGCECTGTTEKKLSLELSNQGRAQSKRFLT